MDQYWNAYSYCGADPVNYVDEWGLKSSDPGSNGKSNGDEHGDDDGDGVSNENDQDQNPGYDSYHGGTFYATSPNADVSNSVPSGPGSPGSPNGPSGTGFDPNRLKKTFERPEYPNGSIESDPLFIPIMIGSLPLKAGKTIVKAGDDVVEDVVKNAKNIVDDAVDVGKKIVNAGKDKWSRKPKSIQDQMALDAAKKGKGEKIIDNLGDNDFKGMEKWEYKVKSSDGRDAVVHYVRDPKTGNLMDFKFKKHALPEDGKWLNTKEPHVSPTGK